MSAWDTDDLKAALPEGSEANVPLPVSAPKYDWGEMTENNYDEDTQDIAWEGNVRVYEWDGEEGEIGPVHPQLEFELFGDPNRGDPQGIDFGKIAQIRVTQEGLERITPIGSSFNDAGLHPAMLRNVELCGYKTPTPIQRYCIPAIRMGYDLLAIAQTGSGKTAAFLIPILNTLMGKAKKLAAPRPTPQDADKGARVRAEPLVVVITPSRELAIQIFNEARKFCYRTMLRPVVIYGGGPLRAQIENLQRGCDILIGTPGRIVDMMERADILSFRRVKNMVIDEADEMLQADWEEQFNKILNGGEQEEGNIKYMLFSATFPTAIRNLARKYLAENYVRIRVGRIGSTHESIKQDVIFVDSRLKNQALLDLLDSVAPRRTIIFVNSKRMADEVDDLLWHRKLPCTSMHADRTQREREDAMRAFRSGKTPILVTTGVTARGIDVRNVMHVINYDLPSMDHGGIQEYIHRIGRTGRIGHRGLASSFYTERDEPIAKLLTMTLMETDQEIPDFLQEYKPDNADASKLKFEYDTDEEEPGETGETGQTGSGWGDKAGNQGDDQGGWGARNDNGPSAQKQPADQPGIQGEGDGWGGGWGTTNSQIDDKNDGNSGW
ncbi:P-loop containing nucleoside triphosphate hydrolase protein [Nemania sp. FL0916]|nr:P-loop containing nucleoside triphosphate hydrolase protein [Nemania sp. FL0916]